MKTGSKLALTLGLASGALLALFASKSTKLNKRPKVDKNNKDIIQNDDSEVHYI